MTCTASPVQHSLFNVTYNSQANLFVTQGIAGATSNSSTPLLDRSVSAIPNAISEAQNLVANLVAESAITYAIEQLHTRPYVQNDYYLRLYEALIEGILEYEVNLQIAFCGYPANIRLLFFPQASYIRMIYSSRSPPLACSRACCGHDVVVNVIGWDATAAIGGYLIPLTIFNLVCIIMFSISISQNADVSLVRSMHAIE